MGLKDLFKKKNSLDKAMARRERISRLEADNTRIAGNLKEHQRISHLIKQKKENLRKLRDAKRYNDPGVLDLFASQSKAPLKESGRVSGRTMDFFYQPAKKQIRRYRYDKSGRRYRVQESPQQGGKEQRPDWDKMLFG